MSIILLLVSSVLLYCKSKYFPKQLWGRFSFFREYVQMTRMIAYGLSLFALVIFVSQWGGFTGTIYWMFTQLLILSVLIIAFPVAYKS